MDAGLATAVNTLFAPPRVTQNASDFNVAIGAKPCAGAAKRARASSDPAVFINNQARSRRNPQQSFV